MKRLYASLVSLTAVAVVAILAACGSDSAAQPGDNGDGGANGDGQAFSNDAQSDALPGDGGCAQACVGGQRCVASQCVCPIYTKLCGGKCIPTSVDPDNCGACGKVCTTDEVCSAGKCVPLAQGCIPAPQGGPPGLQPCGRACVDKLNDNQNCGTCGHVCPASQGCVNGACVPTVALGTPPACPAGGPPVDLGSSGGCAGAIAQTTFRWALCSCDFVALTTSLTTDAYDSSSGPYPPSPKMLGGGVGLNGAYCGPQCPASAGCTKTQSGGNDPVDIGGALWSSGSNSTQPAVNTCGPSTVGQEVHVQGTLAASQDGETTTILDDGYVHGDVLAANGATLVFTKKLSLGGAQTGGGTITVGSPPVVAGTPAVTEPCDCAAGKKVPIGAIISAHQSSNDNASIGLNAAVLATPLASDSRIDLPCGIYYLSKIDQPGHSVTIYAHGRTAVLIDGDVVGQVVSFVLDPLAELDVFIAGTITAGGELVLGSPNYPALSRTYVGGSTKLLLSGEAGRLAGNLYAANAPVDVSSHLALFGALYAGSFTNEEAAEIHYDRGVLGAGADCPGSGSGTPQCGSCKDCGNQACINGTCGQCTSSAQCCAPLICQNGSCLPAVK